jgi:peroxiredoxin
MMMMKPLAAFAGAVMFAGASFAAVQPGQPVPNFTAVDSNGKTHSLSDFKGKTVVLEWTNHECPYVVKHYDTGNMQKLQTAAATDGVVWLSVISSAPGAQGHVSPAKANELTASRSAKPAAVLLDEKGEIGMKFGAQTTPHMYVIDGAGVLRYAGAIDDNSSARKSTVEGAKNYVTAALDALKAGQPVATQSTKAYGCSVKYGS